MYSNEQFKQAITHASPRVAFRMTSQSDSEVITSVGDGLLLEANWEFISESFIGEFPVWKLKASFMYLENKKSYVGEEFLCEVGAYSVNNDGDYADCEWIPIGKFVVPEDGQSTDEIMHQINLTMYDHGNTFDKQYVPLEFPLTGLQIRNQIATRNGLTHSPNQSTLIYDSFIFEGINVSTGQAITDREILRQYAQLNMASVYVDRSGQLLIKSVFTEVPVDAEISNYDYSELKHEVEYGPLNSLIYSNKATDDDQSYQEIEAKDEGSITLSGKKSLEFSNNIFLDLLSLEQQQIEVDKLFAIMNGFSYAPFDLEYFARPDLDPYDRVKLVGMQGQEGHAPITNMSFIYNGGLIGSLKTRELPESLPKSEIPNIFERVDNAEIRVDRANNRIDMVVQSQETMEGSITELSSRQSMTDSKIEQEIIDREHQGEEILNETLSLVEQTSTSMQLLFSQLEQGVELTNEQLELMQTYFRWDINGAIIGKTGSPVEFFQTNEMIGFRENGATISQWERGTQTVDNLIARLTIVIGTHLVEKYESPTIGTSTIVRKVEV